MVCSNHQHDPNGALKGTKNQRPSRCRDGKPKSHALRKKERRCFKDDLLAWLNQHAACSVAARPTAALIKTGWLLVRYEAGTASTAPHRRFVDQIHPQSPTRNATKQPSCDPGPPLRSNQVEATFQLPPCPRGSYQPSPAADSKCRHRQSAFYGTAAQGGYQQSGIEQAARHQCPQKTGCKHTARRCDQRFYARPDRPSRLLDPCRLARLHHHHETPSHDSDMHQGPRGFQRCGLLGQPSQRVHRQGGQCTHTGIPNQPADMKRCRALRLAIFWHPANCLL